MDNMNYMNNMNYMSNMGNMSNMSNMNDMSNTNSMNNTCNMNNMSNVNNMHNRNNMSNMSNVSNMNNMSNVNNMDNGNNMNNMSHMSHMSNMNNMNDGGNYEMVKWNHKVAYINQALYDIRYQYNSLFNIFMTLEPKGVESDNEVMFEVPLDNQLRIKLDDQAYTRMVLAMLFDRSGALKPSCGGRDFLGNAWIKMQCAAQNPVSGGFEAKTEAILWILHPDLQSQDDPIEYAGAIRKVSSVPYNNWRDVPNGWVPQQVKPRMDWMQTEATVPQHAERLIEWMPTYAAVAHHKPLIEWKPIEATVPQQAEPLIDWMPPEATVLSMNVLDSSSSLSGSPIATSWSWTNDPSSQSVPEALWDIQP